MTILVFKQFFKYWTVYLCSVVWPIILLLPTFKFPSLFTPLWLLTIKLSDSFTYRCQNVWKLWKINIFDLKICMNKKVIINQFVNYVGYFLERGIIFPEFVSDIYFYRSQLRKKLRILLKLLQQVQEQVLHLLTVI